MYCTEVGLLSNCLSFRAIRLVDEARFSETQRHIADDICTKLGYYSNECDFVIAPKFLNNDTVELSEVCHVEEVGTGKNKEIKYDEVFFIGSYNEEHQFNLEDYKKADKDFKRNLWGALAVVGIITMAMLSVSIANFKTKKPQVQVENVQTIVEGGLKTINKII